MYTTEIFYIVWYHFLINYKYDKYILQYNCYWDIQVTWNTVYHKIIIQVIFTAVLKIQNLLLYYCNLTHYVSNVLYNKPLPIFLNLRPISVCRSKLNMADKITPFHVIYGIFHSLPFIYSALIFLWIILHYRVWHFTVFDWCDLKIQKEN
jgi:hypothetical protein